MIRESRLSEVADRKSALLRLRAAQKQHLFEVAPGLFRSLGDIPPPDLIVARLTDLGDGTYKLSPAYEQWVRLCPGLARTLGFPRHYNTLYRLGRAGFVEIAYIAPNTPLLNLCSYWGHLANVLEDSSFWDQSTKQGRDRFRLYKENMF